MPTTIMTDVFTLEELESLGDERAVDRALDWALEAWAGDTEWHVSEMLTEILRDTFGKDTLTWHAWDYYRGYVSVSGSVSRSDLRTVEDGPLAGLSWPGGDLVTSFTYRDMSDVSVWTDREMEYGWDHSEYVRLSGEVSDFVREVEGRLAQVMSDEYDYLTSREYLREVCVANDYTFTADGKRFG